MMSFSVSSLVVVSLAVLCLAAGILASDAPSKEILDHRPFLCHDRVGSFADPEKQCSDVFYVCTMDSVEAFLFQCPPGLFFDQELALCAFFEQVPECVGTPRPTPNPNITTPAPPTFDCLGRRGNFPDPELNCSQRFFICGMDNIGHMFFCPAKLFYDPELDQCVRFGELPACSGKPRPVPINPLPRPTPGPVAFNCIGKLDGNYQLVKDRCTSLFIQCSHQQAFPLVCPGNTRFHEAENKCLRPADVFNCPEFIEPESSTALPASSTIIAVPVPVVPIVDVVATASAKAHSKRSINDPINATIANITMEMDPVLNNASSSTSNISTIVAGPVKVISKRAAVAINITGSDDNIALNKTSDAQKNITTIGSEGQNMTTTTIKAPTTPKVISKRAVLPVANESSIINGTKDSKSNTTTTSIIKPPQADAVAHNASISAVSPGNATTVIQRDDHHNTTTVASKKATTTIAHHTMKTKPTVVVPVHNATTTVHHANTTIHTVQPTTTKKTVA